MNNSNQVRRYRKTPYFVKGRACRRVLGWGIARADGGGANANGSHVAQKLGKTRQNDLYGVFGAPPIPTYTPYPENRATGRFGALAGIPPSSENPDSRSAAKSPTDYRHSTEHGIRPRFAAGSCDRRAERKNPARGGVYSSIIETTMTGASS